MKQGEGEFRDSITMLIKGCLLSVDLDQGWTRAGSLGGPPDVFAWLHQLGGGFPPPSLFSYRPGTRRQSGSWCKRSLPQRELGGQSPALVETTPLGSALGLSFYFACTPAWTRS